MQEMRESRIGDETSYMKKIIKRTDNDPSNRSNPG